MGGGLGVVGHVGGHYLGRSNTRLTLYGSILSYESSVRVYRKGGRI